MKDGLQFGARATGKLGLPPIEMDKTVKEQVEGWEQ